MFIRRENFKQYITYYPVVSTLLAINIIVYFLSILPGIGGKIVNSGLLVNGLVSYGEWWRIITAIFLHGGVTHILFNSFSLFIFSPELERMVGKVRFLIIYLASGIMGNVLTYIIFNPFYASLGASGAIFGVFGAYAALVFYTRNKLPQLKQMITALVVVSVIMTFLSPGVNYVAHIGGLVTGFFIGLYVFNPKNNRKIGSI